jgi:hypothetical protein
MSVGTLDVETRSKRADPPRGPLRPTPGVRRGFREFIIVVLGVVTALAADGLRKSVGNRATEREYTARLADELTRGRERIVYNHNRVGAALIAIDTLLVTPDRTRDTTVLVRLALRAANYEYNQAGILHDLTYRELLSTGSLSLMRDLDTRNAITTYYRLAYRAAEVTVETNEGTREYANMIRAATGEAPSKLVQDSLPISQDARERIASLFSTRREIDDELRFLRSRLSDRHVWLNRLLAGTDTLLSTLGAQ